MSEKSTLEDFNIAVEFLSPLQHNILKFLEGSGPISRRDLCKAFDTPRTTVYDNLLKLQKRKIVEKFSSNHGKRGRPIVFWKLRDSYVEAMVEERKNAEERKKRIDEEKQKKYELKREGWLDESRLY